MWTHPGFPQLLVILAYLGLLLSLSFWSNRRLQRTRADFQLASHSIGPVFLLLSLFGTTMTGFALVGSSGEAYRRGIGVYGLLASGSGIMHSLCFFLIGTRAWYLARQHGFATQIALFRQRLESDRIGLVLFPVLVGLSIPYLLVGVISAGTFLQQLTAGLWLDGPLGFSQAGPYRGGIPPWLGAALVCAVVLTYVFAGGMRGTAWANGFQTMVFLVLGGATFVIIASAMGREPRWLESVQRLSQALAEPVASRSQISPWYYFSYLLIPLSAGMFPHLFQHWLTARSAETFKLPVIAHPIFIMLLWVPCVLLGAWATTDLLPEAVAARWGALGGEGAPPPLPTNPNYILAYMVRMLTSPLLAGCLAAGILAAIMSSLDSQFLCLGTIFNNDLLSHYRPGKYSDAEQLRLTRLFILAVVGLTYAIYLLTAAQAANVFALGIWCFSGFSALFPLVVAALYWPGLSKAGAYSGLFAAIISWTWLFYQAIRQTDGKLGDFAVQLDLGGGEPLRIMPVVVIFLASSISLVVVSWLTPKPSPATLSKFFPESTN
jgi:solute:Na+ symporter, SSS family